MPVFARKGLEGEWDECGNGDYDIGLGCPCICIPAEYLMSSEVLEAIQHTMPEVPCLKWAVYLRRDMLVLLVSRRCRCKMGTWMLRKGQSTLPEPAPSLP